MKYFNNPQTGIAILLAATLSLSNTLSAEPTLNISGVVEVETSSGEDHTGTNSSDIALSTIELAFDASINDKVSAQLLVLHEDDDTEEFVIDEGIISIDLENGFTLNAGRMYVPFGNFETHMISDPLTLEIAETQEAALLIEYTRGAFSGSLYLFNGDADEAGVDQDKVDDFGLSLNYAIQTNDMNLNFGIGYINNIADTDTFQDPATPVSEQDAGLAIHAVINSGPFNAIIEHIAAQDMLDDGTEPSATNIEIGYDLGAGILALAYQNTDELGGILPESKTMLSYSMLVVEDVGLTFEYANSDDYEITEGGSGESGSTLTAQLAVEF
ncbi:MAG: LbtU family siderophore porin [Gammaproteobacteria bacterium]|nr:LbtU family siderophore porin [Gammaproteobacteria bacterium]